jgi:hypothetical protein
MGVVWTLVQRSCATVFIHNISLFAPTAVGFSAAAALTQLSRMRWSSVPTSSERRLLLVSAAPALGVIAFVGVSLLALVGREPNQPVQPTRAGETINQIEADVLGPRG